MSITNMSFLFLKKNNLEKMLCYKVGIKFTSILCIAVLVVLVLSEKFKFQL